MYELAPINHGRDGHVNPLQNVSLARSSMTEPFATLIHTMQNICDAIQKKELGGAIRDSMVHTKIVLGDHFQSMKIKGMGINLGLPAQDDDIDELFSQLTFIEPNLDHNKLRKEDLNDAKSLHSFFCKHCHCSHYVYQKFSDLFGKPPDCWSPFM